MKNISRLNLKKLIIFITVGTCIATNDDNAAYLRNAIYMCPPPYQLQDSSTYNTCASPLVLSTFAESYSTFEQKLCSFALEHSLFLPPHPVENDMGRECIPYRNLAWALDKLNPSVGENELWLEFGVNRGWSANITSMMLGHLASKADHAAGNAAIKQQQVYGFDTFTGLPEKWRSFKQGFFSQNGNLPPVRENVHLIKGLFSDTLPTFLTERSESKVAYINVDMDIYNGAVDVLRALLPRLHRGSILHFHEMFVITNSGKGKRMTSMTTSSCQGNDEMRALYDVVRSQAAVGSPLSLKILPFSPHLKFREPSVMVVM
jgi:hypothetical protein